MTSAYDTITVTPDFIQQFQKAQNPMQFLTGELGLGAQQQKAGNIQVTDITKYLDDQLTQQTAQLKAINPAFDPKNYYLDPSFVYNAGEGASSNRNAPVITAQIRAAVQEQAIKAASQAAQNYQQTGQIAPYPTPSQTMSQVAANNGWSPPNSAYLTTLDKKVQTGFTDTEKQTANAAAARVGSPLPYPQSSIGQIAPGGPISNADLVGKDYNQIAQQVQSGSFQSATLPGYAAGGTNPVSSQTGTAGAITNNNNGTYTVGGKTYNDLASATAASQSTAGTTGSNSQTPTTSNQASFDLINNSGLDEATKGLLRQAVGMWNPGSEINTENVLKTFNDIKNSTINPHFQELSNMAIDDVKRAGSYMEGERTKQLETEQTNATQAIRGSQNDLEARGLTFSGAGVEQLGAQSAYAQPGTPQAQQSAIPTQTSFGGKFAEGLVNQGNRLISSSSQAQYQKSMTDLSRQAEQQLGSKGSAGLVNGVSQLGGITGSIPGEKSQAEASTLSNLYSQEQQNVEARKPITVFN